jgi:hypothetical protein
MAIERLSPDQFEYFTLKTHPVRTYSSSSSGITGSVSLFAVRSKIEKEPYPLSLFSSSFYNDENLEQHRRGLLGLTGDIQGSIQGYLNKVNSQLVSARKQHKLDIVRFVPTFGFTSNTIRKSLIRTTLMPSHRPTTPTAHWAFTNYHCLNFFTSSLVPPGSALLYPNEQVVHPDGTVGSKYQVSGAFTFDFWINPKHIPDLTGSAYTPGALFHLTGAYSLTLHTGSQKDLNGFPSGFRCALALSSAANTSPSQLVPGQEFVFWTGDNALTRDRWHHVTFRWGGTNWNAGTGSIYIDNRRESTFFLTESVGLGFYQGPLNPSVLVVGNFYEGQNTGLSALDRFFGADTATREGLVELNSDTGVFEPDNAEFSHPLNAEVHELKLYSKHLTTTEIDALDSAGPTSLSDLSFYLPPFFTEESPRRAFLDSHGGELVTPFFERDGSTTTPFAADMAFSVGGHYINLENYTREFVTGNYPRLWELTGSVITSSTNELTANEFLYATGSNVKRLYTTLPCDNGRFVPNFSLLAGLSGSRHRNDLGVLDRSLITLNDIVLDSRADPSRGVFVTGSLLGRLVGPEPSGDLHIRPGDSLAILHRLRDSSSNQVVVFDVSNMFYGTRIKPGTFRLSDSDISYGAGRFTFTLRDDGLGNLFRADSTGSFATWSTVGNIFYEEGLVVIKDPRFFFFGERRFDVSFSGDQNIHILTMNLLARSLRETTSSNPTRVEGQLLDSDLANEPDQRYAYITSVLVHDQDLNVIARTRLAQPLIKKSGDKYLVKIKLDF